MTGSKQQLSTLHPGKMQFNCCCQVYDANNDRNTNKMTKQISPQWSRQFVVGKNAYAGRSYPPKVWQCLSNKRVQLHWFLPLWNVKEERSIDLPVSSVCPSIRSLFSLGVHSYLPSCLSSFNFLQDHKRTATCDKRTATWDKRRTLHKDRYSHS